MIAWAETIGPNTTGMVTVILKERPHPEQGYRSCLGILRLAKKYGEQRLEAACGKSLAVGARSYRHVDGVLKNGLDRVDRVDQDPHSGDAATPLTRLNQLWYPPEFWPDRAARCPLIRGCSKATVPGV